MGRPLTYAERTPRQVGKDRWWYAGKSTCSFHREEKLADGSSVIHSIAIPTRALRSGLCSLAMAIGKQNAAKKGGE